MLKCLRGQENKLAVGERSSSDYILCSLRSLQTELTVYVIASNVVQVGSNTFFRITEGDTPDALNGTITLSPSGQWEMNVYEQASSTNLDPDNATFVSNEIVKVISNGVADTGFTGTCADGDASGTVLTTINFNGSQVYSATLNTADNNIINVS